jgi:purine-binding chemotaxis protein CheW
MTVQNSRPNASLSSLLAAVDTELAEELRKERHQRASASAAPTHEEIGRHICFQLAGRDLAAPLSLVLEVGELETVRPLPFLPDWVEGVTNIRGEIVSVTNLARFFQLTGTAGKKNRTFLLLHDSGVKTAVMVDKIIGTRLLHRQEGAAPPPVSENSESGAAAALSDFLQGSAMVLVGEETRELQLFDGGKLLASLALQ